MVESILGNGVTTGTQLSSLCKKLFGKQFRGVYGDHEKKPILTEGQCMLINRPAQQHWMAAVCKNGRHLEYDGFCRHNFLDKGYTGGWWKGSDQQRITQMDCGERSIAFLITMLSAN